MRGILKAQPEKNIFAGLQHNRRSISGAGVAIRWSRIEASRASTPKMQGSRYSTRSIRCGHSRRQIVRRDLFDAEGLREVPDEVSDTFRLLPVPDGRCR
jgi:hypothetical protein